MKEGGMENSEAIWSRLATGLFKEETANNNLSKKQEHILFVDDEEMLVNLGRTMLVRAGYKVMAKSSPAEAFNIFLLNPQSFDLIITDYDMPGIGGLDLARAIWQVRVDIPIIISTGFTETMVAEECIPPGVRRIVTKPFTRHLLVGAIREILDSK